MRSSEEKIQNLQILYELAMSIGTSLNLKQMLKVSLSSFLRKLNCGAIALYKYAPGEMAANPEEIFSLPRTIHKIPAFQQALESLNHIAGTHEVQNIKHHLPDEVFIESDHYYYFKELPGYGVLLLIKYGEPLSEYLLKSLRPLMLKLGSACIACENDAELHKQVDEKSKQVRLSRSELIKAKEKAEAASKAKSEFLSTMTHELRTPLNAIIGMTGLLEDTELGKDQQEFVDIIKIGGNNLLAVINDILDYSKIEAGNLEIEQVEFSLYEPLENAVDLLASKAHRKGLELLLDIDPNLPVKIKGDMIRIQQILVNLINNAIKFTERGEIAVRVTKAESAGEGMNLHFTVRDTGIGIPEDKLHRLFRSFSQVDASTTRKYGGTGLGLAISKSLTELMGGKIWVESTKDVGTTFHFTIRVYPSGNQPENLQTQPLILPGKKTVLLVDDNETNLMLISHHCKIAGLETRETLDPARALEWVKAGQSFDLAIIDMHMPDTNGYVLTQQIREYVKEEDMPVILCTSISAMPSSIDRSIFSAILNKPIRTSSFKNTLAQVLGVNGHQQAREEAPAKDSEANYQDDFECNRRILVAEDNAINQKVILRIFSKFGCKVDLAGNGIEAFEAVQAIPYDLVLMDMQMPEMDGIEATRMIRKHCAHQPVIIALTANAMQEHRDECLAAGMDDFLSKPIKVPVLFNTLKKIFSQTVRA